MAIESTFQFADSNPLIGTYVHAYPLSNPNSYPCIYAYTNVYRNRSRIYASAERRASSSRPSSGAN